MANVATADLTPASFPKRAPMIEDFWSSRRPLIRLKTSWIAFCAFSAFDVIMWAILPASMPSVLKASFCPLVAPSPEDKALMKDIIEVDATSDETDAERKEPARAAICFSLIAVRPRRAPPDRASTSTTSLADALVVLPIWFTMSNIALDCSMVMPIFD